MKIAIIDNDPEIIEGLTFLLLKTGVEISSIQTANGIKSGIELILNFKPNLVLLDVELGEGTGFNLLEQLTEFTFSLIIITAHDKYALTAFKFGAIDFIQKPIRLDELTESLKKAKDSIQNRDLKAQLEIVNHQLMSLNQQEQKIVLRDSKSMYFVLIKDILYCEADGNYTTFYILPDLKIVVSKALKEYEEILSLLGFIRPHHSFLVNSNRITKIDRADGGQIIMENAKSIPISQRKRDIILQKFGG